MHIRLCSNCYLWKKQKLLGVDEVSWSVTKYLECVCDETANNVEDKVAPMDSI